MRWCAGFNAAEPLGVVRGLRSNKLLLWIALLAGIITTRNILEGLLEVPHRLIPPAAFFAFSLFYISLFLCVLILLLLLTGRRVGRLLPFVTSGFAVIVLPPIVDWLLSRGEGYFLAYPIVSPRQMLRAAPALLSEVPGVTVGMRIEVALALAAVAVFLMRMVRLPWWKTLLGIIGVYAIICVRGLYPGWIAHLSAPPRGLGQSRMVPLQVPPMETRHALMIPLEGFVLAILCRKNDVTALLRRVRISQAVFYGGMSLWGVALAYRIAPRLTGNVRSLSFDRFAATALPLDELPVRFALLGLTSFLAYWFAQVLNDRFDVDADLVNRQTNLFACGAVPASTIWAFALAAIAAGLTGALSMGLIPFYLYAGAVLLAMAYSAPPLRLKRFPMLSALALGAICTLMVLYGFTVLPTYHLSRLFPRELFWVLLVAVPLGIQVKDLKDYSGDRVTGTRSLPVLLGPVWGRRAIMLAAFAAFLIPGLCLSSREVRITSACLAPITLLAVWRLNVRHIHGFCIAASIVTALAIVAGTENPII